VHRGSLTSMRTLSLQLGQRASLFDCAFMLVLQRGQLIWTGRVVSYEDCSSSPGLGAKKARAPAAMVVPAVMMALIAKILNMSSSKYPNPSVINARAMRVPVSAPVMSAESLLILNAVRSLLSGKTTRRCTKVMPMMRATAPDFQRKFSQRQFMRLSIQMVVMKITIEIKIAEVLRRVVHR